MNPALFNNAIQYGALGLLGVVILVGSGIALTLTRSVLQTFAEHRDAMQALVKQLDADTRLLVARIDTGERAIHENVSTTRQALREVALKEHDETRQRFDAGVRGVLVEIRRMQT